MIDAAPDEDRGARIESPQPDTAAAIAFLQRWRPAGVLTLSAIEPDGPIETKSWRIDRPAVWNSIARWIDGWQGKRNLYFTANETRPIDKKPTKSDVTRIGGQKAQSCGIAR